MKIEAITTNFFKENKESKQLASTELNFHKQVEAEANASTNLAN
jgi:hypothetical protein